MATKESGLSTVSCSSEQNLQQTEMGGAAISTELGLAGNACWVAFWTLSVRSIDRNFSEVSIGVT